MVKKIIKWTLLVIGVLILALVVAGWVLNEPRPKGQTGPEAEALAQKMLTAINKSAWDSTGVIQWDFAGLHNFLWDKQRGLVKVEWGSQKVLLRTSDQSGKAWEDGQELTGKALQKALDKAWALFCNDSFWLNAPAKVMDEGTQRSIVDLEDGKKGLLVEYGQGGVTPGDAYLWILDDQGLPSSWRMWVSIIPIGGIASGWSNWTELSTGAKIAQLHQSKLFDLDISNLKAATSLQELGLEENPFQPMY